MLYKMMYYADPFDGKLGILNARYRAPDFPPYTPKMHDLLSARPPPASRPCCVFLAFVLTLALAAALSTRVSVDGRPREAARHLRRPGEARHLRAPHPAQVRASQAYSPPPPPIAARAGR